MLHDHQGLCIYTAIINIYIYLENAFFLRDFLYSTCVTHRFRSHERVHIQCLMKADIVRAVYTQRIQVLISDAGGIFTIIK